MTHEEIVAAAKVKSDREEVVLTAERESLNAALDCDLDELERKLGIKVAAFMKDIGRYVKCGNAESTSEFTINDKSYYFTLSMRAKAPPTPKPVPRFVLWSEDKVHFAYSEPERSAFIDANPSFQYAQIPQE